jgi:TolB protein
MNRMWRTLSAVVLCVGMAAVGAPAGASVTGANGKIASTRWNLDGPADVFTVDPDGSNEAQVGSGDMSLCGNGWSPDSSRLLSCDWNQRGGARPAVSNPDGSDFTVLDAYPGLQQNLMCGFWSPNGTRFLCNSSDDEIAVDDGLYTVRSTDGGDLTRVTVNPEGSADWSFGYSPDGSQILFNRVSDSVPSALFAVNPDGTGLIRLSPPDVHVIDLGFFDDVSADWSPDGSQVTFAGRYKVPSGQGVARGRGFALYIVNADGTGLQQVTPPGVGAMSAQWSPDGQLIAFTGKSRADSQVWVVRPDGTGLQRVTSPTDGEASLTPVWAPDATALLFQRGDRSRTGTYDLWTVNVDGTGLSHVTTVPQVTGFAWGSAATG